MQFSTLLWYLMPLTLAAGYPPAAQETLSRTLKALKTDCDCTGPKVNNSGPAGRSYVCHDHRLGPRRLPRKLPLMSLVSDYDRLDRLTPNDFLAKWTDAAGLWVYPPQDGFVLDTGGRPIAGNMTLQAGAKVDRFGSEYGRYVSAAEAPYNQRSLPPSNLDCDPNYPDVPYNYHIYTVLKPLTVLGGPIAPWFGQAGLGAQFFTGHTGNILTLIEQGYLRKNNLSELEPAPFPGGDCD